jgi:hypothetical protein
MSLFPTSLDLSEHHDRNVAVIVLLGTFARLAYWYIYPPVWKLYAVYNVFELPLLAYISDFQGYSPWRMPFYDVFAAAVYLPMSEFIGYHALPVFNVIVSIISLPFLYLATKNIYNRRIALFALTLYALYPKGLVLAGIGLPEASGIGFVVFAFYYLARADSKNWTDYLIAGLFAMLSTSVLVTAVLFGIVVTLFLYLRDIDSLTINGLRPRTRTIAFALPSFVFGILYLLYGPIATVGQLAISTNNQVGSRSLFIDPNSLSFIEKSIRYFAYTYFDFWWHLRGFDLESSILAVINGLETFFGSFFFLYLIGWTAVTGILSFCILYGIYSIYARGNAMDLLLLAWIGIYVFAQNMRNIGWEGVFQTRQFSIAIPAICVAFGVGMIKIAPHVSMLGGWIRTQFSMPEYRFMTEKQISLLFLIIILLGLVANGAAQGTIRSDRYEIEREAPAMVLNEIVQENESVGVLSSRPAKDTIIFTDNTIRPIIITGGESERDQLAGMNIGLDVRIAHPSEIKKTNLTYLYVRTRCQPYSDREQSFIDAALNGSSEVVYQNNIDRPNFSCDSIRTTVIRV